MIEQRKIKSSTTHKSVMNAGMATRDPQTFFVCETVNKITVCARGSLPSRGFQQRSPQQKQKKQSSRRCHRIERPLLLVRFVRNLVNFEMDDERSCIPYAPGLTFNDRNVLCTCLSIFQRRFKFGERGERKEEEKETYVSTADVFLVVC